MGIGSLVASLIFSFTYNKTYIKGLLEKGYVAETEEGSSAIGEYVNA